MTILPQSRVVLEGTNFTLTCNATGTPRPFVVWIKVGVKEVISHNLTLRVANVTRPGTSNEVIEYRCMATNGFGSPALDTANITVHCKFTRLEFY